MQADAKNEKLLVEVRRLEALESLRRSYILMWSSGRKIELADAFLTQRNHYLDLLGERLNTGHLLKSDYLEFVSALELVEREREVNRSAFERARDIIKTLTGVSVEFSHISPPAVAASSEQMDKAVAALASNPEILLHQNNVELELERLEQSSYADIKGNFTVRGLVGSSEFVYSDYGYGGMVSLDFSMPSTPFSADSAKRALTSKRLRRLQHELALVTEQLSLTVKERFRHRKNEQANLRFALTRLHAGAELLREKKLRVNRIDGDVLEQLQKARYNYYRVAVDYIEAEARLLNSAAALLRLCPEGEGGFTTAQTGNGLIEPLHGSQNVSSYRLGLLNNIKNSRNEQTGLAVYLWESQEYIDRIDSVNVFKQQNIDKILISLDGKQLQSLQSEKAAIRLELFLDSCREAGISPGVLLGEPTWILPGYRQDLLEILQRLNRFSFDQVHLDMEPYQLDVEAYGLTYLSAQLLRTLQLATEVSYHPLEISIHPRLLDKEEVGWCFGCGISNLDLERVVVMIYKTNVREVKNRMSQFSGQYPELNLAVAQSVESILGPKNSYAHSGWSTFMDALADLLSGTDEGGWQGDIYIQDWASYVKMVEAELLQEQAGTRL